MLRKKLMGPMVVAYYPEDLTKKDPFMLDMKAERCVAGGRQTPLPVRHLANVVCC